MPENSVHIYNKEIMTYSLCIFNNEDITGEQEFACNFQSEAAYVTMATVTKTTNSSHHQWRGGGGAVVKGTLIGERGG